MGDDRCRLQRADDGRCGSPGQCPATLVHACICHLDHSGLTCQPPSAVPRSSLHGWIVCRTLDLPAGPFSRVYRNLVARHGRPSSAPYGLQAILMLTCKRFQRRLYHARPIARSGKRPAAVIDAALRLWLDDLQRHFTAIDCREFAYHLHLQLMRLAVEASP